MKQLDKGKHLYDWIILQPVHLSLVGGATCSRNDFVMLNLKLLFDVNIMTIAIGEIGNA